jgi:hypothetical protein
MAFTQLPTGGGVPNVDLITQTLAKLQPDSALQQYAAMHKNDPYILSLATAESNRRKALRLAAQGQNAGRQPTVADQNIAGMAPAPVMTGSGGTLQTGYGGPVTTGMAAGGLPEDQGIAQLPTPNMQRMADGGIAGYEDDEEGMATGGMGGMFNFAQQSEPVVRMSGGGEVPRYQVGGSLSGEFSGFGGPTPEQEAKEELRMAEQERVKKIVALEQKVAFLKSAGAPQAQEAQKQLDALKADMRPKPSPTDPNFRRQTDPRITGTAATSTPPPPPLPPPPPSDTKPAAGGVRDLLPPTPQLDTSYTAATAPTAADAKAKAGELYDSKGQILSLEGKRLQARQDIANETDTRRAQLEAFSKEQGPAYAGYEKLLQKEELQDATDKEKSGLMSLMKGFLAMAAGESPNAATNIAKGAMVGMGDYGDALKEFKKAAKERTKAMADIENARRAEAKGDFKDQRTFEDRASERLAASDDRFTGLISQITGKEAEVATGIFNNMTNITEETNRMMFKESTANKRFIAEQAGLNARAAMGENRADARAQMLTGDGRTAMMLGSGKTDAERLESGMKKLQEITADKSGMAAVKLLAETNAKLQAAGQPPITMADLLGGAREFSALMYPKVADIAPTRERPR